MRSTFPPDHPAREGLDSFYFRPDLVLRTHTSPMQIRAMRANPAADRDRRAGQGLPPRRARCAASVRVPSSRRAAGRAGYPLGASQKRAHGHVPRVVRTAAGGAFPAIVLSVHRTERGGRHDLSRPAMARRLPHVRRLGLDRAGRCGDGASARAARGRLRSGRGERLGVRRGVERIAFARYGMDDIRVFIENDPAVLEQLA